MRNAAKFRAHQELRNITFSGFFPKYSPKNPLKIVDISFSFALITPQLKALPVRDYSPAVCVPGKKLSCGVVPQHCLRLWQRADVSSAGTALSCTLRREGVQGQARISAVWFLLRPSRSAQRAHFDCR